MSDLGWRGASDYETHAAEVRAKSDDMLLTNHQVQRDGSFWTCIFCWSTWPFPGRVPDDAGPCTPRRWGREQ